MRVFVLLLVPMPLTGVVVSVVDLPTSCHNDVGNRDVVQKNHERLCMHQILILSIYTHNRNLKP